MKRVVVSAGLLLATFCGVLLADDKALKELEGYYSVTVLEKAGMTAPKELVESVKVSIKGDEITIKVMGQDKKAKIKADNSKTPNTIDISPSEGPEKGKTFPGIYKIEKDEVTIVFTEKGERPKELKAEGEAMLMKLKRDK
jgi:uncharacterized protein (TIGR03067 family)